MTEAQELATSFLEKYPEDRARKKLEEYRWPNGKIICPKCGSDRIYKESRKGIPGYYRCLSAHETDGKPGSRPLVFTVRSNTILARSHLPLSQWLYCLTKVAAESISAKELATRLAITDRTAGSILNLICAMCSMQRKSTIIGYNEKSITAKKATQKAQQLTQNDFLLEYMAVHNLHVRRREELARKAQLRSPKS